MRIWSVSWMFEVVACGKFQVEGLNKQTLYIKQAVLKIGNRNKVSFKRQALTYLLLTYVLTYFMKQSPS
jgi:hypothetical protein